MKKYLLILVLFFVLPAYGAVITGSVEYSVESARQELSDLPKTPNLNLIKANFIDENNSENLTSLLTGQTELKDRILAIFSDGSYGVNYKDNPIYIWYYNSEGILINVEIKTGLEHPYKAYKYSPNGRLVNMSIHPNFDESFVFSPQKKLLAHWKGENCYDENDNLIMTRKTFR